MNPRPGLPALARLIATFGYVGHAPIAPGTFGTLAALPLAWGLGAVGRPILTIAAIGLLVGVGTWAAGSCAAQLGRTDPGQVVVDEVAGMLLATAFLPARPEILLGGFVLFRILDVLKPPPARQAEQIPGGFGIMADDLIVAVYVNLLLRGVLHLLGRG